MIDIFVAITQIIWGFGIIAFWIYFFLVENKNPERTEVYLVFEKSFVIPDICWITVCYFISGISLIMNQPIWVFFSIAGGSAMLFLFLMDLSFNIQQGNYKKDKRKENLGEIVINILCLIFGPLYMILGFLSL
ncbi:MAG: hypothetical protein JSV62_00840 [Promethearchaeota archaeon]|nr:MAG: hypothetical protein JSV62_00840 [Candidatus Lokiarchaeota archaeon]